jgi:hypothetical protein
MNIINSKINEKIISLWNKYFGDRDDVYTPLFYDDLKNDSILFVGVNPSFSANEIKKIIKGTEYEHIQPETFFTWKNVSSNLEHVNDCIKIDAMGLQKYKRYFKRMDDISKTLNIPWHHIDTFVYKQTDQGDFLKLIHDKSKLNQFAHDQLEIFKEVLETSDPKVVVVSNAFASKTIKKYFEESIVYNHEHGYHILHIGSKAIPIFFSTMIKTLDTGSFERLVWHIKQSLTRDSKS